ncbi:hypothetical protein [Cellulomonas sp. ATA003]|uniref:hypothetical protein n=1 Tax=Cellulomonas sp. ATA003 TaxID=3073064 RepID=UPI002873873F|nr:hypothetical protein [Cellulomonas sp. ATA003]WNB85072.1 hypothetical protein REH70_15580 [Cellulomonas sp. ATA003]
MDQLVTLGLGLLVVVGALLVLRAAPRAAVVVWVSSICFVPFWLGLSVGPFVPPAAVVGVLVLAALAPLGFGRISAADAAAVLLVVVALLLYATGASTLATVFVLLSQWAVGYVLGRLLPSRVSLDWMYRCLGLTFTVVAVLAVVEFVAGANVFVTLGSSEWTGLQERGGMIRAEGAFGHSIALGACIALVIPLVLASSFSLPLRLVMVVTMLGATAVTFSRIGMVTAALGVVLTVVFARDGMSARLRALVSIGILAAGAALIPLVDETFTAAGEEASGSAAYRSDLLSLAGDVKVIGLTDAFYRTPAGEVYYGGSAPSTAPWCCSH